MSERGTFDTVLLAAWWLLLLLAMVTRDEWTFATAAFFILLDKLEQR